MRGRKPTPTPIRILQGNPGHRPLPENEPVPPEGEIKCPEWIQGRAREIWIEQESFLRAMGVLTVADVPMFAMLCETQAEYIEARLDVNEHGERLVTYTETGQRHMENPCVKIASDANKRAKAMMVEFGMSPSSRTRVKATPKPKEKSPLEKLRERGSG